MSKNKICKIKQNKSNILNENNKKLINNNYNDEHNLIYNKEMSDSEKQKIELSNNVSNKEALKDKIHEIHNYLRNNGAGYGMNALKVFNLLYGLKKIEENKLLDKVNLKRPDCEFSYLLKIANENKDEQLTELILGSVSTSIYKSNISELLFYEIPTNIKSSVFAHLIKEIDKITVIEKTCNVLLSGKIYEYFIGRDESAISELGAYFTDRHIVNYIYKKLDPKINNDGSINSMIDMFGGSGGFTTGYINYLNKKYTNINWKNNINKIYHFDMNEDVIKSAGLEFFCLTSVLPNMNDNLKYKNSFTDEFNNKKFMNVITNPPYGGDKIVQSETQIKRKKIKEYIKKDLLTLKDDLKIKIRLRQLKKIEDHEKQEKKENNKNKVSIETCSQRIIKYAKDNKLTGNDKESSSLILIMDLVDKNGTAIGVLKEGVFFNKTYKDIRKCLIENFNVREIISVPQDQFENTSTKTSIIIFENTEEKTSKVKFYDLVIERYTEDKFEEINGEIVLIENKDDISDISENLISEATSNEIIKNSICSLRGIDYNKKKIIAVGEGYELVKLGDIAKLENGKQLDKKNLIDGIYPVYGGGSEIVGYHNEYNRENCTIIAGTGNCGFVQYNSSKFWASQCFTIKSNDNLINKWLYYYCKSQQTTFINSQGGSVQKFIRAAYFNDMLISIPKSKEKIKEWVNKISIQDDKKNKNEELIIKLEEQIKNKIKDIEKNEDCDEFDFNSLLTYLPKINKYKASDGFTSGLYKFYTSSQYKILYRDDYEFEDTCILIGRGGNTSIHIASKFSVSHDDVYVIKLKDNKDNGLLQFIFNYLKTNINIISDSFKGSIIKHTSKEELSKIKLKIPKNKKFIKDIHLLFQEIETLHIEIKEAELQYKQLIKELSEESIPTNKQIKINTNDNTNDNTNNNTNDNEILTISKKKISKSKINIINDNIKSVVINKNNI